MQGCPRFSFDTLFLPPVAFINRYQLVFCAVCSVGVIVCVCLFYFIITLLTILSVSTVYRFLPLYRHTM